MAYDSHRPFNITFTSPCQPSQQQQPAIGRQPPLSCPLVIGGRRFTAFALRVVGSRSLLLNGVVWHRGRRSGRVYATPVIMRPAADGFVLPLLAGEGADWVQSLRAAGGGVIRWNGRKYTVADPVVIDWAAARPWFGRPARVLVTLFGFHRFVRVRSA